jgi:hypothetical protein
MLLATGRPREAFPSLTTKMVIAFCAIYALMATASARMSQPEWGFDRPGQDYHHFRTSGWQICSASCASQEQCRAYTFVMPTRPGANGTCWLKAGIVKRSASNCCISGVRVMSAERINGDQPGHDLRAGSPVQWADDRLRYDHGAEQLVH